jgi:hypothetical protein
MTWAAVLVTAWATLTIPAALACGYWLSGTHHTKPPAPGPQPPAVATAPANPAPGPDSDQPWMSAHYHDGYVIILDHVRHRRYRLTFPTRDLDTEIRDLLS